MGCQKKIATQVLQRGADYLLSVKDNQPALAAAFETAFPMTQVVNFEGDAYEGVYKYFRPYELIG